MRIVIGNLPDDATEERVQEALSAFAPVNAITLSHESGAPSAIIEMEMSKPEADALAKRIQGRMFQGRELRAWVPIMDWKK
jgi:RNA recognition motif-containing protein